MVRTLAVPLALVALGLAVVFGVIRPVLRDMRKAEEPEREKNRLDAVVDDVEGAAGADRSPAARWRRRHDAGPGAGNWRNSPSDRRLNEVLT